MEQLDIFGGATPFPKKKYLPQTDLKALYAFAKEQAQLHWHRDFDIEIELVNRDWRSTNGIYYSNERKIKMSAIRNKKRTWDAVKGTLLHELVHWHLHTTGLPYRDDDQRFARECFRVGAPISGTKIARKTAEKAAKKKHYVEEG